MYRAVTIFLTLFVLFLLVPTDVERPQIPDEFVGYVGPTEYESHYLFVGDVMLARYVEVLIHEKGLLYPFNALHSLYTRYDAVIANFEAAVPLVHEPTPTTSMQFSVASSSLAVLHDVISVVSLANNHSYDYGPEGFSSTRTFFSDTTEIKHFGHPKFYSSTTALDLSAEGGQLTVYALNAVGGIATSTVSSTTAELSTGSGVQIVYIHWGEEYALVHSQAQEDLAKDLIDAGADAIIGHHPHVVQDIGWYKGAPIFYSLGNFVFDQYFTQEVQTHLALELAVNDHELYFRLLPMTSESRKSSPYFMNVDQRAAFLESLAERSDPVLSSEILRGRLWVSSVLASS